MAKKSKAKILIPVTAALSGGAFCAGSSFLASYTVNGHRQTLPEAFNWQKEHYDVRFYEELEKTFYTVKSYDGYELHAVLCRNSAPSRRYVIISHGYTDNRFGAVKYMKMYLDLGFNCIIYDLRGHGENEPTFCTYSIREGKDLYEMIKDTCFRYGKDILLALHGESLGAASTITALGYQAWARADRLPQDFVRFAVADCPFAEIKSVLKGALESRDKPQWLADCASVGSRLKYGYSFSKMRPIDYLTGCRVPLLFLHGQDDTFIPPSHSERLAAATEGESQVHLIPGAGHAESVLKDPALYRRYLNAFFKKHIS